MAAFLANLRPPVVFDQADRVPIFTQPLYAGDWETSAREFAGERRSDYVEHFNVRRLRNRIAILTHARKWAVIASAIRCRVSSRVSPVAMQPGKSGTQAL